MNMKGSIVALALSLAAVSSLLFAERVRLAEGTPVRVRLRADLLSSQVDEGSRVDFEVARPVIIRGMVVIPEGALAWGAVQSVKKDKTLKFDIEGVRLADLTNVKLRSIREKAKNPGKDLIKIETEMDGGVGARKGSEFTAYVDEEASVEATAAAPAPTPAPAITVAKPVSARVAPRVSAPPTVPAEVKTSAPAVVTPAAAAPAPVARPAPVASAPAATVPAVAPGERVTVECFSDPLGAEIIIDGDFYGTTPSILKVPPGNHRLELQLSGYKVFFQPLNLESGSGLRTIRASLEKKE